jgi:hypothetical protein
VARGEFEAKLELFPAELVVHVLGQIFEALDDDGNLDQHVVHVDADAALLFGQVHALECQSGRRKKVSFVALTKHCARLTACAE